MQWAEVTVKTSHEAMEFVSVIMESLGSMGVVVDDPALVNDYLDSGLWDYTDILPREDTSVVTIQVYLPQDEELNGKLAQLRQELTALQERGVDIAPGEISLGTIADEDWANNWKEYFHTSKIGKRLVIQPSWEDYQAKEDEVIIRLDPGAAFGTGTHPTTLMCLQELEDLVEPGMEVFDVGTGSGVLSIAAVKLGAAKVRAVDYDGTALHVAEENIAMNGITEQISVGQSDLWQNVEGKAKLVTANIIADIIIRLFEGLDEHLAEDGVLLTSGIIEDRAEDVRQAAEAHGFKVIKQRETKEWVCMLIKRESEA